MFYSLKMFVKIRFVNKKAKYAESAAFDFPYMIGHKKRIHHFFFIRKF